MIGGEHRLSALIGINMTDMFWCDRQSDTRDRNEVTSMTRRQPVLLVWLILGLCILTAPLRAQTLPTADPDTVGVSSERVKPIPS